MDLPVFDGTEPAWVSRCRYYFRLYKIPEQYKTGMAEVNLVGRALEWYQGYTADRDPPPWGVLVS